MPMGITSLSAYLKSAGHEVELFDTTRYNIDTSVHRKPEIYIKDRVFKPHKLWYEKECISRTLLRDIYISSIDEFDPDLIGISVGSEDMLVHGMDFIRWSSLFKRDDATLAVGGVVPTISPQKFLDAGADTVVVGEAELTLLDILDDPGSRSGIIYGSYIPVDDLLPPDWDLMDDMYMYWVYGTTVYRWGRFLRSRGCPNRCTYCVYSSKTFPKEMSRVRRKSNSIMIEEMEEYKRRYALEAITIIDDNFLAGDPGVHLEFLSMYRDRIGLPFNSSTHTNTITEELVWAMKDAGARHISMGIESGNEYIRNKVLRRPKATNASVIEAFRIVKEAGIHCASLNMIGLPHETSRMFKDTIDLNRKCMPDKSMCFFFFPYEGLKLRDVSLEYGYIDGTEEAVNMCETSIMKLPQFPLRKMKKYKRTFNIRIRFPKYISGIVGWLAGGSRLMFNLLSKYREDPL